MYLRATNGDPLETSAGEQNRKLFCLFKHYTSTGTLYVFVLTSMDNLNRYFTSRIVEDPSHYIVYLMLRTYIYI